MSDRSTRWTQRYYRDELVEGQWVDHTGQWLWGWYEPWSGKTWRLPSGHMPPSYSTDPGLVPIRSKVLA